MNAPHHGTYLRTGRPEHPLRPPPRTAQLGHGTYLGTRPSAPTINPAVVEATLTERLRRALYEGCDRAPEFSAKHRNLV